MNKKPQDNWETVFEQLPLDTAPRDEHRAELKARVLKAFDESETAAPSSVESQVAVSPSEDSGLVKLGRILMTYKATYWTAAAVLIGLFLWFGQGTSTALAFEDLVKTIGSCRTARYDGVLMLDGNAQGTYKHFYMAPSKSRTEIEGVTTIHTPNRVTTLIEASKEAIVAKFEAVDGAGGSNIFEMFHDALHSPDSTPFEVESLGEQEKDGKVTVGFQVDVSVGVGREFGFTIWADPASKFPVEIEMDVPDGEGTMVLKNYEFDIELDEELFSTDVPDGYTVRGIDLNLGSGETTDPSDDEDPLANMTEETFIAGLKNFAKTTGELPSGVDPISLSQDLGKYMKANKIGNDKLQQMMQELMMPVLQFPATLTASPESNADYDAKDAKVGDGTRPIFWHKPSGEENYRVIYADFSIKESAKAPVKQ